MASLRPALDFASNLVDTTPGYETGHSEQIVGTALGEPVPSRARELQPAPSRRRIAGRLTVLADLRDVPSPRFHLELLHGVLVECELQNLSVPLHPVLGDGQLRHQFVPQVVRAQRNPTLWCGSGSRPRVRTWSFCGSRNQLFPEL